MIVENQDGLFTVIGIAFIIAVGEPCRDFSQIARPDWFTAQHTERLRAGRPAIHQDESHVEPPYAKQKTVSDGSRALGRRARGNFCQAARNFRAIRCNSRQAALSRRNHLRSPAGRALKRSAHFLEQRGSSPGVVPDETKLPVTDGAASLRRADIADCCAFSSPVVSRR